MPQAAVVAVDNTLGAILVGIIVSAVIYGITCLQVYLYFVEYCWRLRDPWYMRVFVAWLMVLDTTHIILIANGVYYLTITNFGVFTETEQFSPSLIISTPVGEALAFFVQLFYAWRIYTLNNHHLVMPIIISTFSVIQFAFSIVTMFMGFKQLTFNTEEVLGIAAILTASTSLLCNLLITITMSHALKKRQTNVKRTDRAVKLLIMYTLNTGAITTVLMALSLAMFLRFPTTLIEMGLLFVCDRVYSCSFMSILNSRDFLRKTIEKVTVIPPTLTSVHDTGMGLTSGFRLDNMATGNSIVFSPRPPMHDAERSYPNYSSPVRSGGFNISKSPGVIAAD